MPKVTQRGGGKGCAGKLISEANAVKKHSNEFLNESSRTAKRDKSLERHLLCHGQAR